MINVAIIGCGNITDQFHLPAWLKIQKARVVGLVDKNIESAKALSDKYQIDNVYKDIESLFSSQRVDAVDICTPNHCHEKDVIFCLKNRKHVICEKPFILERSALRKISYYKNRYKLVCVCAQHQRFRQPTLTAKRLVSENALGDIYSAYVTATFRQSPAIHNINFTTRKRGGGPLVDLGAHFIDLAWWIMGNPKPVSVYSIASNFLSSNRKVSKNIFDVEDYVVGAIRFSRNRSISFQMSYALNIGTEKLEKVDLYGTKGGLVWPDNILNQTIDNQLISRSHQETEAKSASILQFETFIDNILEKTPQNPTFDEMKTMVYMLESLKKSHEEKREIVF